MDAPKEAAVPTQVVVTTHSPDRLDLEGQHLLAVQRRGGRIEIGPAGRESAVEPFAIPGGPLRMDFLEPDQEEVERQRGPLSRSLTERLES